MANPKIEISTIPQLNPAQQRILDGKTPAEFIKIRPGRGGQNFKYVEVGYVMQQLNQAFGFAGWEFKIVDKQLGSAQVWVHGSLTIHMSPEYSITKENFGGAEIKVNSQGKITDVGDDLKAATSDCLKKCASMFGIAADVYFPQLDAQATADSDETVKVATQVFSTPNATPANVCSNCGTQGLPNSVVEFSLKRYGKVLCYNCQSLQQATP